jgi:tetratricopeptide (TPR) repeat protein
MSNVAALKKKAAEFEQRKQLDKAIAAYREILDLYDAGAEEQMDVGLYNRVADLLLRQGSTPEAVSLFERAVDLYTEGGFFNNAIALCNKILRTSPGRASVYYKLGKISAAKGFKGDAKQNFLEYADRMQKAGEMQEAFRALKEFADLCPDQDDIRLLLAEQLTKADKKGEALDQLQLLYARYDAEGRTGEAQATLERMKAIDPNAKAQSSTTLSKAKTDDDLVFLDLNAPAPRAGRRSLSVPRPPTEPVLPVIQIESSAVAGSAGVTSPPGGPIAGLEPTVIDDSVTRPRTPLPAVAFAQIDLGAIPEASTAPQRTAERDLALPGDLPHLNAVAAPDSVWLEFKTIEPTPAFGDARQPATAERPEESAPVSETKPLDIEPTTIAGASASSGSASATLDDLLPDDQIAPAAHVESLSAEAPSTPTAFGAVPIDQVEAPPPVRRSLSTLAASVGSLAARLADSPDDAGLRREYAEALLESGDREAGVRELEKALVAYERTDDLDGARALADEIIRLKPSALRYHQKRVEYAFRTNDRARLVDAYAELADALFRDGEAERAKVVYERVLEISPEDMRAHAALEAYAPAGDAEPEQVVGTPATPAKGIRYARTPEAAAATVSSDATPRDNEDGYVSLGDWLRAEEGPRSTRMVVEEEEPSGDEQKDFQEMLKKFKQGVAENVEEDDHASHYDLGVAYKEMGLIDEAIAQFQKAFRGNTHRVRTYEALGQCFLEKQQLQVAVSVLQRALHEPGVGDEQLVGVLYLLGYISESLGKHTEAKGFYERVFGVDIQFRDVGERLTAMEKALA